MFKRRTDKLLCTTLLLLLCPTLLLAQNKTDRQKDSEQLGIALDYFQGGKYQEALTILQPLDKKYKLNPRFKAYIGVCYYQQWDYMLAAEYLDEAIPQLTAFSPEERSLYYYDCAESHFILEDYDKALALYETMLTLCHDNEKPDAYYKLGFIYVYREDWTQALDNLQTALVFYKQYRPDEQARIAQIRNMIVGCCQKIEEKK